MQAQLIARWIVVSIVAGVTLLYVGVHLAAAWASYALEHRFFGITPAVLLAVDDYLVWGALSLVIGAIVGWLLGTRPILGAFLTCMVSALAYLASAVLEGVGVDALVLFFEPLVASIVFSAVGAVVARRMRSNYALERTRGG